MKRHPKRLKNYDDTLMTLTGLSHMRAPQVLYRESALQLITWDREHIATKEVSEEALATMPPEHILRSLFKEELESHFGEIQWFE